MQMFARPADWRGQFFAVAVGLAASLSAGAAGAALPAGAYLAGRHAQEVKDYTAAASWFETALAADPSSPELINRSFQMETVEGRFDRAVALAPQVLKLDPSDAIANLVLLIDRLKAGDKPAALARAQALPTQGVHRFLQPLALAWTQMAAGDVKAADAALHGLDKFNGFAPLEDFQLGLLYDFAGDASLAEDNFKKALAASDQLNWRLCEAVGNFYRRHGHAAEAQALYQRFAKQNPGSEIAEAVIPEPSSAPPPPIVGSALDGLSEALFDLASVVNQPESLDLALLYDRFAVALRPNFALAELLLSDILTSVDRAQTSLTVLGQIPADSPYAWPAELRRAANLDMLDRSDEAIAALQGMVAAQPKRAGAAMQLGDLLRAKKRFPEAVAAYDTAIHRLAAAGLPERWSLFYSRGIALERSNQWKKAEADLLHALQLKPDQPLVLNYLGYSWVDRGENLSRGLDMIKRAVALRPEDGYIVDSLGWAHYRLGQYADAVKYLEKATELVPEDPTINDHLGDAYWQTGRPREARFQWQQALEFGPQKDEIKPIEAKLDRGLHPPPTPAAAARGG
jgi:tetratricopeptide (TPR) repeat protein